MKSIWVITISLLTIIGCSNEYIHREKRFSIAGRLVDYQCRPVSHTDVYALSVIRSPNAYGLGGAAINNSVRTDDKGRFSIDLYEGEWVYLGMGKSHQLFKEENILLSYDRTALTNLRTVADQEGQLVIYTHPRFDENYSFRNYAGWSKPPRVGRTPKNDLKHDGKTVSLGPISARGGAVGVSSFDLPRFIDMRIRNVKSEPEFVYEVSIQGRENAGLIKAVNKQDQAKWDIPKDGYSNHVKYTVTFPSASYPYELEDKWKHGTFFLKANDGAVYAVVSLDIGLVSSFDLDLHDQYTTDESWVVAVWGMADVISSNTHGFGEKNRRHRLPIASPVMLRRTCGGDYESTHNGVLGHHPKIERRFFHERKRHQDYMLEKLVGK